MVDYVCLDPSQEGRNSLRLVERRGRFMFRPHLWFSLRTDVAWLLKSVADFAEWDH